MVKCATKAARLCTVSMQSCTQKSPNFNRSCDIEFNFLSAWTISMKFGTFVQHAHGYKTWPQIFIFFAQRLSRRSKVKRKRKLRKRTHRNGQFLYNFVQETNATKPLWWHVKPTSQLNTGFSPIEIRLRLNKEQKVIFVKSPISSPIDALIGYSHDGQIHVCQLVAMVIWSWTSNVANRGQNVPVGSTPTDTIGPRSRSR